MQQTSDLVLMVLDATKRAEQRALLEAELDAVGIRLNKEPPYDIHFSSESLTKTPVLTQL